MKNVVKCYKDFFGYFNALKTHSDVYSKLILNKTSNNRFYLHLCIFSSTTLEDMAVEASFYKKKSIVRSIAFSCRNILCVAWVPFCPELAVVHGLSNVRSVTLKVLRAKKSVCITEPYNEGELSNCYNFDLIELRH